MRNIKDLIADWVEWWALGYKDRQYSTNEELKKLGFFCHEDDRGLPVVGYWYDGPIEPGMWFRWSDDKYGWPIQISRLEAGKEVSYVWCKIEGSGESVYSENSFRSMATWWDR